MSAQNVVNSAKEQGVSLWVEGGDRLRYKAAQGMPEDLRETLQRYKSELVEYLWALESAPQKEHRDPTAAPSEYVGRYATPSQIALVQPPAQLSINELYQRLTAKEQGK